MMRLRCLCVQRNMSVIVPSRPTPPVTDHERAVPASAREQKNVIVPPHPTGNWSWKSSACVCRTARKMMRLRCLCVQRNMSVIVPSRPTPPVTDHEREQCLRLHESRRTLLSHPTPPVTDHERAAPVSAGQQERWWGCGACVCTGTWALLSHPTPQHPTAKDDESAVTISRMRHDEGVQVSDILLTGCTSEWGRASEWNSGCASEGLAGRVDVTLFYWPTECFGKMGSRWNQIFFWHHHPIWSNLGMFGPWLLVLTSFWVPQCTVPSCKTKSLDSWIFRVEDLIHLPMASHWFIYHFKNVLQDLWGQQIIAHLTYGRSQFCSWVNHHFYHLEKWNCPYLC